MSFLNQPSINHVGMEKEMQLREQVDNGFERVADVFRRTVKDDGQSGASLAIWVGGARVVELASGVAYSGSPFTPDTLSRIYSCTKGIASILIARLMEQGKLPGLDTPVAKIWPEFGAHGKDQLTIGDALAHRAGLSALREELPRDEALQDWKLAAALADQEPLWLPGSHHMYHAATHGAITAELVRRATDTSIGQYLAKEVAQPLDADVYIGLPPSEEYRLSSLVLEDSPGAPSTDNSDADHWINRANEVFGPFTLDNLSDPVFHRVELAGMGGVATADGLAKFWSATVTDTNGYRLINDASMAAISQRRSWGPGYFGAGQPPFQEWGAGVMVASSWDPYLSGTSFGHDGAGGQVSFADPDARVGFAYLTNKLDDWQRGISVVGALREALG